MDHFHIIWRGTREERMEAPSLTDAIDRAYDELGIEGEQLVSVHECQDIHPELGPRGGLRPG